MEMKALADMHAWVPCMKEKRKKQERKAKKVANITGETIIRKLVLQMTINLVLTRNM